MTALTYRNRRYHARPDQNEPQHALPGLPQQNEPKRTRTKRDSPRLPNQSF